MKMASHQKMASPRKWLLLRKWLLMGNNSSPAQSYQKNLLCPLNIQKISKLNFLCQIKFKSNLIWLKKSNQIKSNFLDYDLCFKLFFKLFASTKRKQIKSNQICGIMFFISNFFQIFRYNKNKSNQIKSNFVAII